MFLYTPGHRSCSSSDTSNTKPTCNPEPILNPINHLVLTQQGDCGNWSLLIALGIGSKVDRVTAVMSVACTCDAPDPAGDWPAFTLSFVLLFSLAGAPSPIGV